MEGVEALSGPFDDLDEVRSNRLFDLRLLDAHQMNLIHAHDDTLPMKPTNTGL